MQCSDTRIPSNAKIRSPRARYFGRKCVVGVQHSLSSTHSFVFEGNQYRISSKLPAENVRGLNKETDTCSGQTWLIRLLYPRKPLALGHKLKSENWELLPPVLLSNIFKALFDDDSELSDNEIVMCVVAIHQVCPAWRFALSEMMRGETTWPWLHRRLFILDGNIDDFIKRGQALDSFTGLNHILEDFDFFGQEASPKNVLYIKECMEKAISSLGGVAWLFTAFEGDLFWIRCDSEAQYDKTWAFLEKHVPNFALNFRKPSYDSSHEIGFRWDIKKLPRQEEGFPKIELPITFDGNVIRWGSDWGETLEAQRQADLSDPRGIVMQDYENPVLLMNGRIYPETEMRDPACKILPVISMSVPRKGMSTESRVGYTLLNFSLCHTDETLSEVYIEGNFSGRGGFSSWSRDFAQEGCE